VNNTRLSTITEIKNLNKTQNQ